MATVDWAVEASGNWHTPADWSTGSVPGASDDVVLSTVAAHTVMHSSGADSAGSITATTDRLKVSGGSLHVLGTADLHAGLRLSGGTLALAGNATIAGGMAATGGTLAVGGGTVATVVQGASLSDGVYLTGLGTLSTGGTTVVGADGGALVMGGGVTWSNSGRTTLDGSVQSGSAAHIVNQAGGRFLLAGAAGILRTAGAATFLNAGTLAKTGGGTSEVDSTLTSTGTVSVADGTLLLTSGGRLGGTLGGAGTLELGSTSRTTLADLAGGGTLLSTGLLTLAAPAVTLAATLVQQGGTLRLGAVGTLTTSGRLDLLDGAVVVGHSTLATGGATSVGADGVAVSLQGGLTWDNEGAATVGGSIQVSRATTLDNQAGGSLVLTADAAGLIEAGGASSFANAGALEKSGGTGTSEIDAKLGSTGTIAVATGTLLLTSGATLAGSLDGAGTLELAGKGNQVAGLTAAAESTLLLAAGIDATVADSTIGAMGVNQGTVVVSANDSVAGAFTQNGGEVFIGSLLVLDLQGSAAIQGGGTIGGTGTLATAGTTMIGADSASITALKVVWSNSGSVVVDSVIASAGPVRFLNTAGASFGLATDAAGIADRAGVSEFDNAGTLAKLGGDGTSSVASLLTSTGTIDVASGTLALDGGGAIGGAIGGAGTLLFGGGEFSVASGTAIRVSGLAVTTGAVEIGATLLSSALSLSGGALDLEAAGNNAATSLLLSIASLTLEAGVTLSVSGAATLDGGGTLNGAGTLLTAGATTIAGGAALTGGGTWVNAGSLATLGGASTLDVALASTGTITVATGTLALDGGGTIGGSVGGAGMLLFGGGNFGIDGSTAWAIDNLAVAAGVVTLGDTATPPDFAVADIFTMTGGSVVLAAGGVLALDGGASFVGAGTIGGSGTLGGGTLLTAGSVSLGADGSATSFADGLLWRNTGTVTALGQIASAGAVAVSFDNAAGAVFDLAGDGAGIVDDGSASSFTNEGILAKTGGSGTSSLYTSVTSTGTILAASGTLALEFAASLAGLAGGADGGRLLLVGGASSAAVLAVADNGNAISVQLSSFYASWTNTGTVSDAGRVLLGNGANSGPAILYNAAGAVWDLTGADASIGATGRAIFTNAGTLAGTAGAGRALVTFGFTNTGLVDAGAGTLTLLGTLGGSGAMRIEAGGTLELGQLPGSGQTLGFAGAGATLKLDQPASIAEPMQGFGAGDGIDLATARITAASIAGDVLSVTAGGTYSFVSSLSLAGLQTQIAADGSGGSIVTLLAAPEPSGVALAAAMTSVTPPLPPGMAAGAPFHPPAPLAMLFAR